ncbi:MAG: methyltransferase domain-containing protein [Rhodobacteraceae bacterium]|nr:methyltransferase domain-containing protein [Paracoccaceae bacterium]
MNNWLRNFIAANRRASTALNNLLPQALRRDGNRHFRTHILPGAVYAGATVYDVGGGSQPFADAEMKRRLGLRTVGVDIDAGELAAAPAGTYDAVIVADLCTYAGVGDADIVICQATLEHVPDTRGAILAIASILKPDGKAYVFAPCRNAAFARLNLVLPQRWKERILYAVSPEVKDHQGFPAHYDHCVPTQIEQIFDTAGLRVVQRELFWMSSYFMVFTPLFVVWRIWQSLFYLAARANAAETFIYVVQRKQA